MQSGPESKREVHQAAGGAEDTATFVAQSTSVQSAASDDVLPAGATIGRYRIVGLIGEGGMGQVYRADQVEPLQRVVALKIIKSVIGGGNVIARFEAERQLLAMMDHPNIAKVLDAGSTVPGQPYFVMELVDGLAITEYCDVHRLSIRERIKIFIPVCRAVQHAHQKGIIHRDIKPSNILVATYDNKPIPKVIDFGIAKIAEQAADSVTLTRMGGIVGTLAYMSPEQADGGGGEMDTRADIYSLGAVLYELLTGVTPHDAALLAKAGYMEIVRRLREDDPPPPSSKLTGMPGTLSAVAEQRQTDPGSLKRTVRGELDWIVMKAIEKDRARRYATANSFMLDLERFLDGEPLEAGPASAAYRLGKMARKYRGALAIAAAFTVLLIAAATLSLWQAVRANRERDRAIAALHLATAQKLAGDAMASLSTDPERGILLGMYAIAATSQLGQAPAPAAEGALHASVLASRIRAVLHGHKRDVRALAFSPDGKRLVTGSDDGPVKVWDMASGRELLSFYVRSGILGIAYSPDGNRIATANSDKTATLWDASSGTRLVSFVGHSHMVTGVSFAPDGKQLATSSLDRTARIWETASGRELRLIIGHGSGLWSVAFSPDGARVATASEDKTARVWEVRSGKELLRLRGHQGTVVSVAFSPDGKRLATGSSDRSARVWDAVSGQEILHVVDDSSITWVAFSPDGTQLATAGLRTKVWETVHGQQLFAFRDRAISKLAFSPTGTSLAVAGLDHAVEIWHTGPSTELLSFSGGASPVAVVFSRDSKRLATFGESGVVRIWDASDGRFRRELQSDRSPISDGAFSPDGASFATSSRDGTATIQDIATGRELVVFREHAGGVRSLWFSPDGKRLVTGGDDKAARVWDATTGRELLTLRGHDKRVVQVAFSPDGERMVTASDDGSACVWDSATGKLLFQLRGHKGRLITAVFTLNGQRVATVGIDGAVRIWSMSDGQLQLTFQARPFVLASSPRGDRLITAQLDPEVWSAKTGQHLFTLSASVSGPNTLSGGVYFAAYSEDGKYIAATYRDGLVRVYAADVSELVALAKSRVTRQLTSSECWTYLQSNTCPALP